MDNRIKEVRLSQIKTIEQVANELNVAPITISRYERNNREPKIETWQKLADYFGVPIPYLQGLGVSRDVVIGDLINELT